MSMKTFLKASVVLLTIGCFAFSLSGCTVVLQKGRNSDVERISSLSEQLTKLKMTSEELGKLQQAYDALEKSLEQEINDEKISLGIEKKGLVITFVDSVLFDSGKAEVRSKVSRTLDKVAKVALSVVGDREMGVEGHTDNQPIKHSGWKSNWELSSARAMSVVHYLIKKGVSPERLSAIGYSQYRPVATNITKTGKQKNRRVEIVILPGKMTKVRPKPIQSTTPKTKKKISTKKTSKVKQKALKSNYEK